ncbi:uncharacterized protein PG986_012290 [Apiospora aurea]|uniref:General negative regulator of transcription subunit 4 n=1 Tax=Apiospora aurea TaxID=335848 RepID=A0ABR1Q073_9PEZI
MAPQDSFIDEEEDTCPLCIEEFDLSDRNFRPCPCGYQICQFCFNNLKNNLNGLCPACRRPYDEKTIQWKVVTQEEIAEFRANIQKNQKKRAAEQRQKEVQKREVDKGNRKNLVGVRVVQKNLVYVTGLTPTVPEDELLKTLRRPEFFGQYGNIQKISISNRKAPDGAPQSLGIYVTFEKKDDATRCIQAVNGSMNGDRVLKAQLGTTKYCSAWLRHEQCGNRQCMFLHELGDEEDSYSRQDLSSLNSVYTQRPLSNNNNNNNASSSSRSASRQQGLPPQQQPSVAQAMQRSRRGSHATSGAASSPAISNALPVTTESAQEAIDSSQDDPAPTPAAASRRAEKKVASAEPSPNREPSPINCRLPGLQAPQELDDSEVPLFDMVGGMRRRAMREEEENRLGETAEPVPEPIEPEEGEPESGSLALGGEPEDRDQGRGGAGFDQRRSATQPPIQRNNPEGIFGPALTSAYAQGSANPGSIGSRTMTPQQQQQQQLFMRPQSFVDQMPPGISNPQSQSSLFQGQGHPRQQSRFSFANESTTNSTNVKLTANPRIMAQQSSMMPSTYHSQPSGQFYASSMPGPPPGLKSTGTPPVSGGMFGQGHSFGGSGFGIGSKDNPNDLLQNLIRGRGTGSGQAHDAGKREYFSSFPNQYPPSSSSTPAPASGAGIMASLYATQPGGFQDFGPKQKKKGKKHRHANTSSSGGGALVDLADPSILQARLPHQQQGTNAGVGQGLFGGQSQGGYNPNMMYGAGANYDDELLPLDESVVDARSLVDALVSDPYPLEFGSPASFAHSHPTTPGPPPGLGYPQPHPIVQFGEAETPSHPPMSQGTAVARPPPALPQPVTPLKPKATPKKTAKIDTTPIALDAKKTIVELALESGLSKDIAAQASGASKGKVVLQEEDFPALDSKKATSPPKVTPVLPSKTLNTPKPAQSKKTATETGTKGPIQKQASSKADKRPTPGTLDIAAATKVANQTKVSEVVAEAKKPTESIPSGTAQPAKTAASAVATPTATSASISSPLTRPTPKTLRLVQTPKTELPPSIPPAAAQSIRAAANSANRPGTPASEIISDSASVISASVSASRTSSPPPSKIGTASVRATTKSQQRKQRKEASKEATAAIIAETKVVEQEAEIAPILGRKKKQKKEKKPKPSNTASPAVSRPETPVSAPTSSTLAQPAGAADKPAIVEEKPAQPTKATKAQPSIDFSSRNKESKSKDIKSPPLSPAPIDTSIRLNESTKTTVLTPDYINPNADPRSEPVYEGAVGEVPSLSEILQSLIEEGELPDPDDIGLFKAASNHRSEIEKHVPNSLPPTVKSVVTKEDEAELSAFRPVHKSVNGHRVLLTPNGDFVLNLTEEEEKRFLELQSRVAKTNGFPTAFSHPKYNAPGTGFSLISGRAVPNGLPSFFPSGPSSFPQDPVGKMHREEAIGCINQHVLPSLNLGSYKSNSSFPNPNATSLQSLAPWLNPKFSRGRESFDSIAASAPGSDGMFQHVSHSDSPHENWDDEEDDAENPSPAIGSTPLMSIEEAEQVLVAAKKQHDATDKKFKQAMGRLRRQFGLH